MSLLRSAVCAAVLLLGAIAPSSAAVIQTFTSRAAWEAAVIEFTIENLSTAPVGALPVGTTALGLIDFTYTEATPAPPRILAPGPGIRLLEATVGIDAPGFPPLPASVTISLPEQATAFGAFFNSATSAARVGITIAGAFIDLVAYLPPPGDGFFGFISDVPFQNLIFSATIATPSNPGEIFSVFDLEFNAVPEPSTLGLFTLGGLFLAVARSKTRKSR